MKGEVAHGCKCNDHYCKLNVLLSRNRHFLQALSPMSLSKTPNLAPSFLVSFNYNASYMA